MHEVLAATEGSRAIALNVLRGETRTTCPYCGVGCGVVVNADNQGAAITVAGDTEHPANRGRLCSKGSALAQTVSLEGRLLTPLIREAGAAFGAVRRASWDEAIETVASRMRKTIDEHGPEAVALYVSGQLLTEDYYVANKLVKGWFGTAQIDTNSRLCMASAVVGYKRAFGEDIVPCSYDDIDGAELIVLVGSNTAWCHPVLYQRIVQARSERPSAKLVVIDPRRTATCEDADLHLPIVPGMDGALFNGLLSYLAGSAAVDVDFVGTTTGFAEALVAARASGSVADVADACGLQVDALERFFSLFAATDKVVTLFSQGINQSSSGSDKVNAIINCHLVTGRIGKPGAGPFSITGQPNAMGGREVGGFANTLAAHLDINDAGRSLVQDFWKSPRIAERQGLKAVDLFEAIHEGKVRAIWIIGTNPVVSLPDADRVREALARCEFVVVSDCVADTDTAALAHVLLPAAAWGEKDGTVTNSERRISRQRAFLELPGEARPDWWVICEVAKRLGFGEGFEFASGREIFTEHARLSAYRNEGATSRYFNLEALTGLSLEQYEGLVPVRWPVLDRDATLAPPPLPAGARFIPIVPSQPTHSVDKKYPLVLNTGRMRDQWHTMTRTGRAHSLNNHAPEPFVEIHPEDALSLGLQAGYLARLSSHWGAVVLRVVATANQRRGNCFAPIHWSGPYASDARIGALVSPTVDPWSGEPEFKQTPVTVEPFSVDWFGALFTRDAIAAPATTYWTRTQQKDHLRYELGGRGRSPQWHDWVRAHLGGAGTWLDYADPSLGVYRAARVDGGRLMACLYVSSRPQLPSRSWVGSLFAQTAMSQRDRMDILAGAAQQGADLGPIVCSCFGVGALTLKDCISRGARTTSAIGASVRAGTNCGSCLPELRQLLRQQQLAA